MKKIFLNFQKEMMKKNIPKIEGFFSWFMVVLFLERKTLTYIDLRAKQNGREFETRVK